MLFKSRCKDTTVLYEPNETESAGKMTGDKGALASLANYIVQSTHHVSRCRNMKIVHLIH